eukprot:GHVO01045715.1.p1 GENE.GHVO01045715.1~~GHVO01045715.1.p1  ORF type:complete len:649 (+),score=81.01 GHVO01045715.1:245-2191(+)
MKPVQKFEGHKAIVNSISQKGRFLVTGSWDGYGLVWDVETGQMLCALPGHQYAVSVLLIAANPDPVILSGSQDAILRLWKLSVADKTVTQIHEIPQAHTSIIRGIVSLPCAIEGTSTVATCGNDGMVCLWNIMDNSTIENSFVFPASASFIYDIKYVSIDNIVYLLTSCEDKTLGVWDMRGNLVVNLAHRSSIWQSAVDSENQIVTISGDSAIRTWTFNEAAAAPTAEREAYMLKVQEASPTHTAPEVPSGVEDMAAHVAAGRTFYEGDEFFEANFYDRIIDVEIEDGGPMKMLPFRYTDDTQTIAQKFVAREGLKGVYVRQIVEFIEQHRPKAAPSTPSRIVPPSSNKNASPTSNTEQVPKSIFFPSAQPVSYETINTEGVLRKIKEFNEDYRLMNDSNCLSEGDFVMLQSILDRIKQQGWLVTEFRKSELVFINTKFLEWRNDTIFPIMDIWRILLLHPQFADYVRTELQQGSKFLKVIVDRIQQSQVGDPVALCCTKLLANTFVLPSNRSICFKHYTKILSMLERLAMTCKTPQMVSAISTVLYNFCATCKDHIIPNEAEGFVKAVGDVAHGVLGSSAASSETLQRTCAACGTLLHTYGKNSGVCSHIENRVLPMVVSKKADIDKCADDLIDLMNHLKGKSNASK